jgi:hypothetical protein
MRLVGHVTCTEEKRNAYTILVGESEDLEDLAIDGIII